MFSLNFKVVFTLVVAKILPHEDLIADQVKTFRLREPPFVTPFNSYILFSFKYI